MEGKSVEVWDSLRSRVLATGSARPWGGAANGFKVILPVEINAPVVLVFADGESIPVTIGHPNGAERGHHDAVPRD